MFRHLIGYLIVFFSFNLFASPPLEPLGEKYGLQTASCQIVFEIEQVNFFSSQNEARYFCDDLSRNFGIEGACFIRGGSGSWEGNFRYRSGFNGNRFRDVFSQYNNFLTSRRWYDQRFIHRHRFFNCLE